MRKEIKTHLLAQLSPIPLQPERLSYKYVILLPSIWPLIEFTQYLCTLGKMMYGFMEEESSCCAVKTTLEVKPGSVVKGGVEMVA